MKTPKRTWLTTLTLVLAALCLAVPTPSTAEATLADDTSVESRMNETAEAEEDTKTTSSETSNQDATAAQRSSSGINREAMVVFGQNAELKAGETAQVMVVIGGSAKIQGKVREAVVVIGGDAEIDGEVGQEVVVVMGSVRLRPGAVVHGDVVSVGGSLDIAEGATVKGTTQEVAIGGLRLPRAEWIKEWLQHCGLMFRPLAPQVGWVWLVALVYFLLFLLIAAVFRHPVQVCVDELEHRPATTFIIGLLTKLFLPLLVLILLVIVIGIVVVPFLAAGLFVLTLVGKVAVLEWIGFKLSRLFGKEPLRQPVLALIIGSVVLTLLYLIPLIGLLSMLLLSVWSLGCAMSAAFGGFRSELPARGTPALATIPAPAMAGPTTVSTPVMPAPVNIPAPVMSSAAPTPPPTMPSEPSPSLTQSTPAFGAAAAALEPPVLPDTLAYPKASFWERMAAGFLDVVLVVILGAIVQGPPFALIVALAYFTGLWAWKGTSVGGIVLGLKVIRSDGEEVSFVVALVRALAAGFSAIMLFLGFFWIAWDPEKQGWHDKIAGTVVLKLPKGTPLVCL